MNIVPGVPPLTPPILADGQNAVVEVHRSLGGSVKFIIKDAKYPNGYYAELPPGTAIAAAGALVEAAGKMTPELKVILMRLIEGSQKPGGLLIP